MPKVRCADCGFLAIRDRMTRELVEVEVGMRKKWELPTLPNSSFYRYEDFPICLQHKVSLRIEKETYRREDVIGLLEQERECDGFTAWQHGFGPKEHQEMQLAQEIQRRQDDRDAAQRRWQDEQDRARREREAAREAANREWQEKQNQINRTRQLHLAIFAALVGLVGVLLGKYLASAPQPQPIIIQTAPAEPKP